MHSPQIGNKGVAFVNGIYDVTAVIKNGSAKVSEVRGLHFKDALW